MQGPTAAEAQERTEKAKVAWEEHQKERIALKVVMKEAVWKTAEHMEECTHMCLIEVSVRFFGSFQNLTSCVQEELAVVVMTLEPMLAPWNGKEPDASSNYIGIQTSH